MSSSPDTRVFPSLSSKRRVTSSSSLSLPAEPEVDASRANSPLLPCQNTPNINVCRSCRKKRLISLKLYWIWSCLLNYNVTQTFCYAHQLVIYIYIYIEYLRTCTSPFEKCCKRKLRFLWWRRNLLEMCRTWTQESVQSFTLIQTVILQDKLP
jgi:hypothetical protein